MPKIYETSERAIKEFLQTRYYKANAKRILDFLNNYYQKNNITVVNYNDEYMELSISTEMYDMTIRPFQFSISETAVDLFIDSRFLFDFGKTKKVINEFYDMLAKNFPFIGLALGK